MDTAKVIKISEPLLPGPHRGVEKPPGVKRLARHRPEYGSARQARQERRRGRGKSGGAAGARLTRAAEAGTTARPKGNVAPDMRSSRNAARRCGNGRGGGAAASQDRPARQGQERRPARKAMSRRTCGPPGTRLGAAETAEAAARQRHRTDPRGRGRGGEGDRCELKARIEPQAQGFRVKFVSLSGLSLRRRWTFRKK